MKQKQEAVGSEHSLRLVARPALVGYCTAGDWYAPGVGIAPMAELTLGFRQHLAEVQK